MSVKMFVRIVGTVPCSCEIIHEYVFDKPSQLELIRNILYFHREYEHQVDIINECLFLTEDVEFSRRKIMILQAMFQKL